MAGMRVTPGLEALGGKFTQEAGTVRQLQSGISRRCRARTGRATSRNKFQQLWEAEYREGLGRWRATLEQTSGPQKQAQQYRIADQQGG
ncbi:MAG: hypothetical protein U0U69_02205 [Acidimicrobiia bacterium]